MRRKYKSSAVPKARSIPGSGADVPAAGIREGGSTHPIKARSNPMRTPQSHTAREEALVEIRQRPDAGTRPAPETSAAGAATMRVVGAAAIALAASLVIENMVVLAGAPTYWAPIKEVLAFHAEHRGAVAIAVGLEALNVPLLLGVLTGLHGLVGRRGRGRGGGGRGLVAPAGGRGRELLGGLRVLRRSVGRSRAARREARRAEPG